MGAEVMQLIGISIQLIAITIILVAIAYRLQVIINIFKKNEDSTIK